MKRLLPILLITLTISACGYQPTPDESAAIASIVAATLDALPTDTAIPPVTHTPPQTTVTQPPSATPVTPSPTPSHTPTLTLTPTITPSPTRPPEDPVLSLGQPTWEDHFNSEANWSPYEDSSSKLEIKDGKLIYTAFKADNSEYWGLSWPEVENFYLEYTGMFGEECAGKDRFGMLFRAPKPSKGYLFGISCNGTLRLYAWDGDRYHIFKDWKKSDHINTGPGATNRIGIRVKGTKLTGYVNGHELVLKEGDLYSKGKFGVFIASSQTPGFQIELDRAAYWTLP